MIPHFDHVAQMKEDRPTNLSNVLLKDTVKDGTQVPHSDAPLHGFVMLKGSFK